MYIKSIILDGFKSFGNRVNVTGFDPVFNAITGLNGSGKSNILDSILFVLGINNLSNLRAGSLEELIYKHGKAGITEASVSITFDNRDKCQCPIGYENHDEITVTRQVVMGGKNNYLINGINVQKKRVTDLFCSVQLNVDNPNFLITQEKITKVLNMKPQEILSMVEESSGISSYKATRNPVQNTIEQNDAKLRKLNDIIKKQFEPKLQTLRDETSQFQEYQKLGREIENQERINVAWKYVNVQEKAKKAAEKVTEIKDKIKSKQEQINSNEEELKVLDEQVIELSRKVDKESGSELRELEERLKIAERCEANVRAAKDALGGREARAGAASTALQGTSEPLQDLSHLIGGTREASEASEKELTAGRPKAPGREVGATFGDPQREVEQLQGQVGEMSLSEERRLRQGERLRALRRLVRARRLAAHALAAALRPTLFRYRPPAPDFDAHRVAGPVCKLIQVCDPMYCIAIEAAAGEKLYNVVVDTEATGRLLLQQGQLEARTTFIWLDKISGLVVNKKTVRLAQEICGGEESVQLALELVSFEARLRPAMAWVFGGTLVCRDAAAARRLAFHARIRRRAVSLDGHVFDPAGTMSADATPKGESVLMQLKELARLEAELREAERELAACAADLATAPPAPPAPATTATATALHHKQETTMRQEKEVLRQETGALGKAVERDKATRCEAAARAPEQQLQVEADAVACDEAKERHQAALKEVKDLKAQIKKKKAEIASLNGDMAKLLQKKDQLLKNNNDLELKIKELEYKINGLQTVASGFKKKIKSLKKENPWIPGECESFGVAGGLYNFQTGQAHSAAQRLQQLRERRNQLAIGLNPRAHTLLGKMEEQYEETMRMKSIVEAERAKFVEVLAGIDTNKDIAIAAVGRCFASLVGRLAQGVQARLEPPPARSALHGLQIEMGFNSQWRESLAELSGGERCIAGLSLLLALSTFRPAPLYLLDEVDAALDRSHAHDICQIIKQYFKRSQLIFVSLKNDMLDNANVLFHVGLVDGMSAVQRIANSE